MVEVGYMSLWIEENLVFILSFVAVATTVASHFYISAQLKKNRGERND
jgi:hypothetical protein